VIIEGFLWTIGRLLWKTCVPHGKSGFSYVKTVVPYGKSGVLYEKAGEAQLFLPIDNVIKRTIRKKPIRANNNPVLNRMNDIVIDDEI